MSKGSSPGDVDNVSRDRVVANIWGKGYFPVMNSIGGEGALKQFLCGEEVITGEAAGVV